jgi:hypothetical protein
MNQNDRDLIGPLPGMVEEGTAAPGPPLPEQPTLHYTELPEDTSGPIATEWNCYRREAARLLSEGHGGKWVLIKGDSIIGIWASREQATEAAVQQYLMQPVLIHQILEHEPIVRCTRFFHPGYLNSCRS